MNRLSLIIRREYMSLVARKSFIVTTLLMPVLMIACVLIPIGGISASFSKKVSGGFNIGPKDGSYFISFTDETFRSLISEYLRPATRKILFGE